MPRQKQSLLQRLAPADLAYAVDRLVAAGKATLNEVLAYAAERPARIVQLEKELRALRVGLVSVVSRGPAPKAKGASAAAKPAAKAAPAGRRRVTMTPKMKIARKLQGRYLGLLRSLNAGAKAAVKKIAQTQGVAAAVKEAERRKK